MASDRVTLRNLFQNAPNSHCIAGCDSKMGNSVSGHNIESGGGGDGGGVTIDSQPNQNGHQTITDYILSRQPQYFQQQHQHHWSQKPSPHTNNNNSHNSQVKVLPELKAGPRLRSTNNGCILHNGGTISGRKDAAAAATNTAIYRSRSLSSPYDDHAVSVSDMTMHADAATHADAKMLSAAVHRSGHPLMQRSRTQLVLPVSGAVRRHNMLPISCRRPSPTVDQHIVRQFGSQPNLRDGVADGADNLHGDTNNNRVQQRPTGGQQKKKRAAPPAPPPSGQQRLSAAAAATIDYDPCRFGWKSAGGDNVGRPEHVVALQPVLRKLRRFKTKAESTSAAATKVPLTAGYSNGSMPIMRSSATVAPLLAPPPPSSSPKPYRREKSFDLSLLLYNRGGSAGALQPQRHSMGASSQMPPVAKPPAAPPMIRTCPATNGRSEQLACNAVAAAASVRKLASIDAANVSGPAANANSFGNDFKRELLAATRKRSVAMSSVNAIGVTVSATAAASAHRPKPVDDANHSDETSR